MTEKVITVYDNERKQIVGLIIVEEIELYYISNKIVMYLEQGLKSHLIPFIASLQKPYTNIPHLVETLSTGLKQSIYTQNMSLLEPYALESENKNKSSRNKRMIEQLNLPHRLERSCFYSGKKGS
jgi:hypothetical protein